MKRRLMLAATLAAGLFLLGLPPVQNRASSDGPVMASGAIRAQEVRIASEIGGRIVEIRTQVGAPVEAGSVLVELDKTPVRLLLDQAEVAVTATRSDLAVVKAGPHQAELSAARAAVSLAQAQAEGALSAWRNAQDALENPLQLEAQIIDARKQLALAGEQVQKADSEARGVHRLYDAHDPTVTAAWVTAADETLAAAQADEVAAQTLLDQLLAIREKPLALLAQTVTAEGEYRVAKAGVAVAEARLKDLEAGPTPHRVALAEAAVCQAEAQANVLRVQERKLTLKSPIDGAVLHQALKVGEVVAPAATILTLSDLSEVTLEVFVPENLVARVQLGQEVQVSVDSFPGRAFMGRVARIGSQPEYTPRNVATAEERVSTFYAVEVHLPNAEGLLKPGMPADAVFIP